MTVFVAPAVLCLFGDVQSPTDLGHCLAFAQSHFSFTQLGETLSESVMQT